IRLKKNRGFHQLASRGDPCQDRKVRLQQSTQGLQQDHVIIRQQQAKRRVRALATTGSFGEIADLGALSHGPAHDAVLPAKGIRTETAVPRPGAVLNSTTPPTRRTRSSILSR